MKVLLSNPGIFSLSHNPKIASYVLKCQTLFVWTKPVGWAIHSSFICRLPPKYQLYSLPPWRDFVDCLSIPPRSPPKKEPSSISRPRKSLHQSSCLSTSSQIRNDFVFIVTTQMPWKKIFPFSRPSPTSFSLMAIKDNKMMK